MDNDLFVEYMESPLGDIEICAIESGLISVSFVSTKDHVRELKEVRPNDVTVKAKLQLLKYFRKEHGSFALTLSMQGTDFQQRVWTELCKIPFGKTISYLKLAKRLGDEKCIRAAASANGK